MKDEHRFIIAISLSIAILLLWQFFVVPPPPESIDNSGVAISSTDTSPNGPTAGVSPLGTNNSFAQTSSSGQNSTIRARSDAAVSLEIATPELAGSISTEGTTFDMLRLLGYRQNLPTNSPPVELFKPGGIEGEYFAQFGWVAPGRDTNFMPGANAIWQVNGKQQLTPNKTIVMNWDNGNGVSIKRTISLSENYMFTISDEVTNSSSANVSAAPWGILFRSQPTNEDQIYILHEGPVGYFEPDGLLELDYDDLTSLGETHSSANGWVGITDKYWAGILVPKQGEEFRARYTRRQSSEGATIQTDYVGNTINIPAGTTIELTQQMFAGPKVPRVVDKIAERWQISGFDLVIDWGIFYFLTKPLMWAISYFNDIIGNYGIAILVVTVIVKIIFFPLAYKSYVAMSRMQKMQPQLLAIREEFGNDQAKMQKAMAELYRAEKINPAAGCVPILLQIPVFFSLYKVIYISIELRHAPFFGWIHDLSAPDPTSLFNLFGLLPFSTPQLLTIGIWPILMGLTMFLQMQLAPMNTVNPVQKTVFRWMPLFFVFLLAPLPSGLIIYWVGNNVLSIAQQAYIMKRNGAKIALKDNLRDMFSRKKPEESDDSKPTT